MGAIRAWLAVILVISAMVVCESEALSGAMEVDKLCDNYCQKQSLRIRQVTTNNEVKQGCMSKCNAYFNVVEMKKAIQRTENWGWGDFLCDMCGAQGDPFACADVCSHRDRVHGLVKQRGEKNEAIKGRDGGWRDICVGCTAIPAGSVRQSCLDTCRSWMSEFAKQGRGDAQKENKCYYVPYPPFQWCI